MRFNFITAAAVAMGVLFYVVATVSTFTPGQIRVSGLGPLLIILLACMGGAVAMVVGYASMVAVGGRGSLDLAKFFARVSGSKQVIQLLDEAEQSRASKLLEQTYLFYTSVLIYFIAIALGWDIYNADGRASFLQPIVHALDAFSNQPRTSPVTYSVEFLPVVVLPSPSRAWCHP